MRLSIAFAASILGTGALAAAAQPEEIVVEVDHVFPICAGDCPRYRLSVSADGRTEIAIPEQFAFGRARSREFRVSRHALERFRARLAPLRPAGVRESGEPCGDAACAGDWQYEIEWRGPDGTDILRANPFGLDEVYCRIALAVADLGIDHATGARTRTRLPAPLRRRCDRIVSRDPA